uniref:methyltransferase-like protein 5 isoform X2 n=1 Tax=Ciona intestinalis TaxID=7719 RepID=UPI0002B8CFD4|nr:methyltransferase-like protein 5 isoform X2 [Ciona intestinalis]|eukprot:XP_004225823.1 methyltransferase-like protein 5 isoform X2 [Ciona intestinalis]
MKLRQLEIALEDAKPFQEPKIQLEQYVTTPHLAACLLHTAETQFGDICGKNVCDLGCGCGILSIGSSLLGANHCLGIDIDEDALEIFQSNCEAYELNNVVECIQADIARFSPSRNMILAKRFDTVLMNPPFGTKSNKGSIVCHIHTIYIYIYIYKMQNVKFSIIGIDMEFLHAASILASHAVYSLHKSSTRAHIVKKANDFGMQAQVVAEMRYNLESSYKFHKKKSKDIEVDFIRFTITTG